MGHHEEFAGLDIGCDARHEPVRSEPWRKKGAFLEVTDEGAGFDVRAIVDKMRSGENYYSHAGSGFRRFAKTDSVISYANGGRTFRACFLATLG